ncbi:non-heme iron oxygenase ferredoxin subunit [Achromobacter ruhlandii]|uniref:Naphthalene 1,2-dioxygenase/salicylate 5-hydroxylase systems, ferredoxin component n=1 Tax=Achromobacter ruhlandii TaxID=72557 RepID=A0ABM8LR11_9BURK|nr:non-heme iron oxygenase ferredoxin subunit [Achromobacter ruhlandii]AKP92224.1 Ferredoxin [Achromobacter xylosoxidans]MCZ8434094.1 non-heme iron oxygenase ferredoxin subunit [Achromobacter ruhlandii]MDC6152861.1 non-heme iron oxygenase ferredoxin subunit [Achromobacter ruhlandii]MDD7980591.1 non-heme iron oxygenase ferredoxin subunit [Achromobacter ruhlandii]CAB3940804.1 Naphthalene 1,2-dioxygenase/salicylate 5-hydroxylase systems, ferredoxin component [Achromobacter ruhlandii]
MSWINVAPYTDIEGEETLPIEVDGQKICLYNLDGEVFATDNQCTHGDAALSDGLIQEGGLIECPLHEGTFDIRTGKAKGAPCTQDLHCHEIKVEGGVIYLRPAAR